MPGTIQVSVIEFNSLSSSSNSSAKSLKVSMGKRQYHTYDKGDFSFPLTKLREDLVVALLDAGGIEMAHAEIRTMQIIEKGSWDEVFFLDGGGGGGHVHMKLQFILSEEDRKRVRTLRESAIKRKHETGPTINFRRSDTSSSTNDSAEISPHSVQVSDSWKRFAQIDVASPKAEGLQADSSLDSATSSTNSLAIYQKEEESILRHAIPVKELYCMNATDTSQSASSSPVKNEVKTEYCQLNERVEDDKFETESPFTNIRSDIEEGASSVLPGSVTSNNNDSLTPKLQDDPVHISQYQGPIQKTPSSVRKMISALESSKLQDVKSRKKSASVPSRLNKVGKDSLLEVRDSVSIPFHLNKVGKERLLEVWDSKVVIQPSKGSLKKTKDLFSTEHLHQTHTSNTQRANIVPSSIELPQVPKELESSLEPSLIVKKASDTKSFSSVDPRTKTVEERERTPVGFMEQLTLETATDSRKMDGELFQGVQSDNLASRRVNSSDNLGSKSISSIDPRTKTLKERERSLVGFMKQSTLETATNLRRMDGELFQGVQSDNLASKRVDSSDSSVIERREICMQSFTEEKTIPSSESEMLKVTETKVVHDEQRFANPTEPVSGSSPEDSSNGLIGLVIKVVIVLGFGVLVLLTRQKEPRKKSREENVDLFTVPGYVEEKSIT